MNKKKFHGAHVGSASILLIFALLALISFATLSLVNSKANYNLTDNLRKRQTAYYNACHQGNAFVAAVDSGYDEGMQNGIIKESIPLSDNQSLDITIMSNKTDNLINSKEGYSILQWQIVNNDDSDYDYTLPVYK